MGYRSTVNITIKVEDYKVKDLLHLTDFPTLFREALAGTEQAYTTASYEEGLFSFNLVDVKWYAQYPEVEEVMAYLETLKSDNYHFIRIGEDFPDHAELGDYEDEVCIVSDLSYP